MLLCEKAYWLCDISLMNQLCLEIRDQVKTQRYFIPHNVQQQRSPQKDLLEIRFQLGIHLLALGVHF
jgi:hypothetical protein